MKEEKIKRRAFLGQSAGVVAGVSLASTGDSNAGDSTDKPATDPSTILNYHPQMHYRRLGKTDLHLSEVSLGGHWRNRGGGGHWGRFAKDEVPRDVAKNRTEVVSACIDAGINMVDITTSAECCSYGVALKGRREKFYVNADDHSLCIRVPENRTVEKQVYCVEECLRRLQTDYLDVWRPQAMMDGTNTDDEVKILIEAFQKIHKQGKARFLGISSHEPDFLQHVVETFPEFQVVVLPCTAKTKPKTDLSKPLTPENVEESGISKTSIFDSVKKNDVGLVTIKPFSGGGLFPQPKKFPVVGAGAKDDHDMARLTLQCILVNDAISATVPGMSSVYEVENNAHASYTRMASLDWKDMKKFTEATDRMWASLPEDYKWLQDWEWV
jgi:predicted aldo/keto reductase-like oxidoreductase